MVRAPRTFKHIHKKKGLCAEPTALHKHYSPNESTLKTWPRKGHYPDGTLWPLPPEDALWISLCFAPKKINIPLPILRRLFMWKVEISERNMHLIERCKIYIHHSGGMKMPAAFQKKRQQKSYRDKLQMQKPNKLPFIKCQRFRCRDGLKFGLKDNAAGLFGSLRRCTLICGKETKQGLIWVKDKYFPNKIVLNFCCEGTALFSLTDLAERVRIPIGQAAAEHKIPWRRWACESGHMVLYQDLFKVISKGWWVYLFQWLQNRNLERLTKVENILFCGKWKINAYSKYCTFNKTLNLSKVHCEKFSNNIVYGICAWTNKLALAPKITTRWFWQMTTVLLLMSMHG